MTYAPIFYEVRNQLSFNYVYYEYDIVFMCGPVAPDSIYVYCDPDPDCLNFASRVDDRNRKMRIWHFFFPLHLIKY